MHSNNLFSAVDIGASKVVALVGASVGGRLDLLGYGESPRPGVQRGDIVDMSSVLGAVGVALAAAERQAGAFNQVRRSYYAVSGSHLRGVVLVGSASVSGRSVSASDVARALADADAPRCEPGRCLVQRRLQGYRVDGRRLCSSPVGQPGRRVEIECFRAEASLHEIERLFGVSEYIGAPVREFIPASIASAQMASTPGEREAGVLVVDIGASVTDFVLYSGGRILSAGVVHMGGDDVTHDLEVGLRLRPDDAETLKITVARAYTTEEDKREFVLFAPTPGVIGARRFLAREIHSLVEARLARLLAPIREAVEAVTGGEVLPIRHAILTGKAAAQTGFDQLAARILGMQCERIEDREWKGEQLSDPRFSTARGVFELAGRMEDNRRARPASAQQDGGKFLRWYRSTKMAAVLRV